MEYLPFGEVKVRTGSDPVHHTFTGHEEDLETSLIYANARYYDPVIGRFITADPTVQRPSDPQDLNRYAYARNNPVRFIDPSGYGFFSWLKKLFKKVGKFFKKTIGRFFKKHGATAGGVIGSIAGLFLPGGPAVWGAVGGAIGGGVQAALNGGKAGDIILGAIMGAIEGYAIGSAVAGVQQGFMDWKNAFTDPDAGFGHLRELGISEKEYLVSHGEKVFTNGVGTKLPAALAQAKAEGAALYYNPSHGFWADFTEAALQKLTGTSSFGRGFGSSLVQAGGKYEVFGYSQGALTALNAFSSVGDKLAGSTFTPIGSPASRFSTNLITRAAGVAIKGGGTNLFDPIQLLQPTLNPVRAVGAAGGLATLGRSHVNYFEH